MPRRPAYRARRARRRCSRCARRACRGFLPRQDAHRDRGLRAGRRRRYLGAGGGAASGALHPGPAGSRGAEHGRRGGPRGDQLSRQARRRRRPHHRGAGPLLVCRRRAQGPWRPIRHQQVQLHRQPGRGEFGAVRAPGDRRHHARRAQGVAQTVDLRHARIDDADRDGAGAARRRTAIRSSSSPATSRRLASCLRSSRPRSTASSRSRISSPAVTTCSTRRSSPRSCRRGRICPACRCCTTCCPRASGRC